MTGALLDHHRQLLADSAISDEVAATRGYYSATKRTELTDLGFQSYQRSVPALVIPIYGIDGQLRGYQARPDKPRVDAQRGRLVKYETPGGATLALDVPRPVLDRLRSVTSPLWITEGARKADAAVSAGLCCVSLPGVWAWKSPHGAEDLIAVEVEDRKVLIAFDSDAMVKVQVHRALEQLAAFLGARGAIVLFCYLPRDGAKVGLDDYLAAGHSTQDLWRLVEEELRPLPESRIAREPALPAVTLLDVVERFLQRFVRFPAGGHEVTALALYVMHTWAFASAHATPYLYVKSPQRRSGKTRLLEVLELVCRDAMRAASISEAGLFQAVEAWRPTLLLDEVDATFTSRSERAEAVRGILNAGNRPNSYVVRGTQDGTPAKYGTFCAKVLAGIDTGKLPDTIRDRSIVIGLERKLRSEAVDRLRERELRASLDELRERLTDWAAEHAETLAAFRITQPIEQIDDRLEEAWEPLLAVADVAGGDWPTRARAAAIALSSSDAGAEDHGQLLLAALRDVFEADAMFTTAICAELNADDELPFGGYRRGEGIDGRGLARLLRPYGIKPQNVRIADEQAKGYERSQFAEAWERYAGDGECARGADPQLIRLGHPTVPARGKRLG